MLGQKLGTGSKKKHAKSIGEATQAGANWQDASEDFEKGFLKVMESIDEDMPPSTKRSAPEGTPDRESQSCVRLPRCLLYR